MPLLQLASKLLNYRAPSIGIHLVLSEAACLGRTKFSSESLEVGFSTLTAASCKWLLAVQDSFLGQSPPCTQLPSTIFLCFFFFPILFLSFSLPHSLLVVLTACQEVPLLGQVKPNEWARTRKGHLANLLSRTKIRSNKRPSFLTIYLQSLFPMWKTGRLLRSTRNCVNHVAMSEAHTYVHSLRPECMRYRV